MLGGAGAGEGEEECAGAEAALAAGFGAGDFAGAEDLDVVGAAAALVEVLGLQRLVLRFELFLLAICSCAT